MNHVEPQGYVSNDITNRGRYLNMSVWKNDLKVQKMELESDTSQSFKAFSPYLFKRDEEGSFTVFSLFIFLMIIFICGMGVDLMRFETERSRLQAAIDSAALAAANLRSESDAKVLAREFMARAGYDPNLVSVEVEETLAGDDSSTPNSRQVSVEYDLSVNPFFIDLVGIDYLQTTALGSAAQSLQSVEISMVLDISSSMQGTKLQDLKVAANQFVDDLMPDSKLPLEPNTAHPRISIVPYNHTVAAPKSLLDQLNTQWYVEVPPHMVADYNGGANSVTRYRFNAENSRCVRFPRELMTTTDLEYDLELLRSIPRAEPLELLAYFTGSTNTGDFFERPEDSTNRSCNPEQLLLPWETKKAVLHQRINSLEANGNTAIDVGLKWGISLLDPSMRSVVNDLVDNDELSDTVRGHPKDYDPRSSLKIVVLMTDGRNTVQYDQIDTYKRGPSTVWHSELASLESADVNGDGVEDDVSGLYFVDSNMDGVPDRPKNFFDGFYLEDHSKPETKRFLRSHALNSGSDGVVVSVDDLPTDARQLTWPEVFDRFILSVAAGLFTDSGPGNNSAASLGVATSTTHFMTGRDADQRMVGDGVEKGICDAARHQNDILIFTIAFDAPAKGSELMKKCASSPSHYFDAGNGAELKEAFETIASSITRLRLTQ